TGMPRDCAPRGRIELPAPYRQPERLLPQGSPPPTSEPLAACSRAVPDRCREESGSPSPSFACRSPPVSCRPRRRRSDCWTFYDAAGTIPAGYDTQNWGWGYQILLYIDQGPLWSTPQGALTWGAGNPGAGDVLVAGMVLAIQFCPAVRSPVAYPY